MRPLEIQDPDEATWEQGELRYRVLSPLLSTERTTADAVDAAARELGIGRAQCYRLLRKLRAERTVTALLPAGLGRRTGSRVLVEKVESVVASSIDDFYLDLRGPTVSDLMREIERRCADLGISAPSRTAVSQRIKDIDAREVTSRRKGATYARRKLGPVVGHLTEDRPLGLVQVDHTLADVMIVSASDRLSLQRPWLTLAIDVATRMVAGFYVSLDPPSTLSVALTLSRSVLPKEAYLQAKGVDLVWPVSGLPGILHLDNAKEFRSLALRRGVAQYGIDLQYRPPATPHWGGHIERLIGTMMGAVRLLPGATGRSVADRPLDPEASATMTLDEFEAWFLYQVAGVYHHSVHRGLGKTPIEAWSEALAGSKLQPQLPQEADRFELDFMPFREREITRTGISLFRITYSDGVLSTFPVRPGQRFVVRYDPRDMSTVYLRDEEGTYWPIPYSDKRMPPVSLSEIKAASRRLRAAGERDFHQRQIFSSIERQREIVQSAETESRRTRRERERLGSATILRGARSNVPPEPPSGPEPVDGPILPYPIEEWSR